MQSQPSLTEADDSVLLSVCLPSCIAILIAIVGTTVAPWQLFFQQSNVIDKRITPRWLNNERTDTIIGSFLLKRRRNRKNRSLVSL